MMMKPNREQIKGAKPERGLGLSSTLLATAIVVLCFGARPGRAALVLDMIVENSTPSGSTGSFDVILQADALSSPGSSALVGGFAVDLTIPGYTGIQLSGINTNTAIPYIFSTTSLGFLATTDTATEVAGNDLSLTSGTLITEGGSAFGLIHVTYAVAPGAVGTIPISLEGLGSTLSDDSGNLIPVYDGTGTQAVSYRLVNGLIDTGVVPEPSTLALVMVGLIILAGRNGRNNFTNRR